MIKLHLASKKSLLILLSVLVATTGVVAALELTNTTHFFHKKNSAVVDVPGGTPTKGGATGSIQKGEPQANTQPAPSTTNSTQPGDAKSNNGGSASITLIVPSGDFVSNHHPNLGGTPAPNTISSVCTTTAGATCTISFTNNGVVKSLAAQTTDRGGSAYWNWNLQQLGLTPGSWQIQASATLNGATKTTNDVLNLEVAP